MQLIAPDDTTPQGALVLDNTADVMALDDDLRCAAIVVLRFPTWTDGRAYSQAVLLRARLRYAGEIRAVGDVLIDMLPLLRRCGFNAAQLRADQNPANAERALGYFPAQYQADASGARPVYARPAA